MVSEAYSRRLARQKIKALTTPDLPREIIVHHRDENPLNNDLDNLQLMENSKHLSHHNKGKLRPNRTLETLDKIIRGWNTSF